MAHRSWARGISYDFIRWVVRVGAILLFGLRCKGRDRIPPEGAALVCSNHQSFLDPVLVGLSFNRRLNYLARKSLFAFGPFGWLIEFVNAIPIDRDGTSLGGIKEALRRLKRGEMLLIFPEGTRTPDGEVAPLKPGFLALARRSRAALLPVGLDGAFDAWPRHARFPRPMRVHVCIGEPMPPEMVAELDDDQLIEELERRIRSCCTEARAARLR